MSRVAAIHQPNFFPWLGYFDKIARSDVFVVLDDVQHQKTGSNWSTRVKLLVSGEPRWVSAPVRRPAHGTVLLHQLQWDPLQPWREKLLKTLELSYARCPQYEETMALVEPLVRNPEPGVAAYNLHAVRGIAQALGLATPFVLASSFAVADSASQRLAALTAAAGCDSYLAGAGAQDYQDGGVFEARGIRLVWQDFRPRPYPQRGLAEFVPGLSVIDALMNAGLRGTRELLELP
ncbi:WbqC family protein [Ramlibacter rhizophilus]|uniref:WbqC family protein n=1 Tax=Ramlibacter rhizophilus TaxID=1781167 RepID=UPI00143249DE|nr:WbqC family protein [Ramlibacter rhizophilus]